MKRFFFCAVGVIFLTCNAWAGEWTPELDAYIENARKAWEAPGIAVVAVRDGKVIVAKGYGVRRLGKPDPVDGDTVFDIASLSKSFTAAAIATLVDEGKMRWDDPVRRHLPHFELADPYRTHHLSIRDLLAHRAALERSDSLFVFAEYEAAEVIRRMRFIKEAGPFRSTFVYSNLGYIAVGEAAAAAAKTSFVDLLRTRLLLPLGMTATTAGVSHVTSEKHASPHSVIADVAQPIRDRKATNAFPANAINTTARDLATWLIFQLGDGTWEGKRIISTEAMQEMHSIQMIIPTTPQFRASRNVRYFGGYGLGWNVMDYRGHPMLWHSGGADGMPTYMAILPEKKIGVAVMINTWAAPGLHGALAARILDTLLDETPKDSAGEALTAWRGRPAPPEPARTKDTKPSRELDAYAGVYEDPLYGAMTVRHENGTLSLQFGRGDSADLEHWHYDTFRAKWRDRAYESLDTNVAFSLDATGKPVRLQFRMNRDAVDAGR